MLADVSGSRDKGTKDRGTNGPMENQKKTAFSESPCHRTSKKHILGEKKIIFRPKTI